MCHTWSRSRIQTGGPRRCVSTRLTRRPSPGPNPRDPVQRTNRWLQDRLHLRCRPPLSQHGSIDGRTARFVFLRRQPARYPNPLVLDSDNTLRAPPSLAGSLSPSSATQPIRTATSCGRSTSQGSCREPLPATPTQCSSAERAQIAYDAAAHAGHRTPPLEGCRDLLLTLGHQRLCQLLYKSHGLLWRGPAKERRGPRPVDVL